MGFPRLSPISWVGSLLSRLSRVSFRRRPQSSEHELASQESVSRFIYSSSAFSRLHGRPKPAAFNPEPYQTLSVVHSTDLTENDIWRISKLTLGTQRGREKVYGRADLRVEKLIAQKLKAMRDDRPFERHTSVIGWPKDTDPNQQKADIKAICLELSHDPEVKLVLPQSPITVVSEI